jgi:large subunit ribosomal protein L24
MGQLLKKDKRPPVKIQLKKNDQVKVIAGKDKGKTGRILNVDSASGRIMVEQINIVKKHTRKNPAKQIAGGVAESEASIAVSNVMIVCSKCGAVRIKHTVVTTDAGVTKRQRVCHKCGGALDKK